jgi:hypothetical protein
MILTKMSAGILGADRTPLWAAIYRPREKDCPPRPEDGLCQCCGEPVRKFHLDHCHDTGAFRGWVCHACNTGVGKMDDVERLEKRVAFLKAHIEKTKRIALIKAVHLGAKPSNAA